LFRGLCLKVKTGPSKNSNLLINKFKFNYYKLTHKGEKMEAEKEKVAWQAWTWIKWKPGASATAWEEWSKNSSVAAAWSTSGEWDCVLALKISNPAELESFIWKTIRKSPWVESTSTTWAKQVW
jgi:DNA-binding Lrp family transcriptional regulator